MRVVRDLLAYFGIYYITAQMDGIFTYKEDVLDDLWSNPQFLTSLIFMELALTM